MTDNSQKAITPYDRTKAMAANAKVIDTFIAVCGSRQAAQAYIQSALMAVANNNALMDCDPKSIMITALRAATLRLSCDPALGQAYPVPYKGKATLQIGYKGLEQLAHRTGKYRFINTGTIDEGQIVEEDQLTGSVKIRGQRISNKILGYFNYFELFSGYSSFLYMTVEELHEHAQRYSKSYSKPESKWQTDFHSMAKKTVLRLNLSRHGVLTTEDKAVIESITEDETGGDQVYIDSTFDNISDEELRIEKSERKPEAQSMSDLGFSPQTTPSPEPAGKTSTKVVQDDPTQPPAPKNAPAPVLSNRTDPVMDEVLYTSACNRMTSEKTPRKYGDVPTENMTHMLNSMAEKKAKGGYTPEQLAAAESKAADIKIILAWRQAHP